MWKSFILKWLHTLISWIASGGRAWKRRFELLCFVNIWCQSDDKANGHENQHRNAKRQTTFQASPALQPRSIPIFKIFYKSQISLKNSRIKKSAASKGVLSYQVASWKFNKTSKMKWMSKSQPLQLSKDKTDRPNQTNLKLISVAYDVTF